MRRNAVCASRSAIWPSRGRLALGQLDCSAHRLAARRGLAMAFLPASFQVYSVLRLKLSTWVSVDSKFDTRFLFLGGEKKSECFEND